MSGGLPQMLISRHVTRLIEIWGPDQVRELLKRSGLRQKSGLVERIDDQFITMQNCQEYKQFVRELFGDRTYDFARVNFILGGCRCPDCKTTGGAQTKPDAEPSGPLENRDRKRGEDL
jgi:hypothetical protein